MGWLDGTILERYRLMVADLESALAAPGEALREAAEAIRSLVDHIEIGKKDPTTITLHGTLARLSPLPGGYGGSGGGIWSLPYRGDRLLTRPLALRPHKY